VRALHTRAGRARTGRFLVEGPGAVRAALEAHADVREVIVAEGAHYPDEVVLADRRGARVSAVPERVLREMAETAHPQGILAVCRVPERPRLTDVLRRPGPVVALDGVGDPGNVGTIIRTADAAGAAAVLLGPGCADPLSGKVVRSTAGSLFHLPVVSIAWSDAEPALRASGRTIAATTGAGEVSLGAAVATGQVGDRTAWVIGSEAHGVSAPVLAAADLRVRIPLRGRAESLNAAVAAAIVLFAGLPDADPQTARVDGGVG
jgi:TrmH family RNA methyltransferase